MKAKETFELIMELGYGAYGGLGSIVNVSPLGFAELTEEYEEKKGNTFYYETNGKFSKGIYVKKILKDRTFVGVLDDKITPASISSSTLKDLTNIDEILLNEYLERLEVERGEKFIQNNHPDFKMTAFANMVKEEPYYFSFDNTSIGGYFECLSTIEESKNSLQDFIDFNENDEGEEEEEEE